MVSSSVDAIAYMTCGDGFSLKDAEFEEWRIEKLLIWGFRVVGETPPPPPPFKVLEAPLVLIPQF
jgi:hypothetical protein